MQHSVKPLLPEDADFEDVYLGASAADARAETVVTCTEQEFGASALTSYPPRDLAYLLR